jgi:hypothetical protein
MNWANVTHRHDGFLVAMALDYISINPHELRTLDDPKTPLPLAYASGQCANVAWAYLVAGAKLSISKLVP